MCTYLWLIVCHWYYPVGLTLENPPKQGSCMANFGLQSMPCCREEISLWLNDNLVLNTNWLFKLIKIYVIFYGLHRHDGQPQIHCLICYGFLINNEIVFLTDPRLLSSPNNFQGKWRVKRENLWFAIFPELKCVARIVSGVEIDKHRTEDFLPRLAGSDFRHQILSRVMGANKNLIPYGRFWLSLWLLMRTNIKVMNGGNKKNRLQQEWSGRRAKSGSV